MDPRYNDSKGEVSGGQVMRLLGLMWNQLAIHSEARNAELAKKVSAIREQLRELNARAAAAK